MLLRFLLAACLVLLSTSGRAAPSPVLRVGISDDYAPFARNGRGFDIDAAHALAKDLGYRIEWVRFRWPDLARDARSGAFDIAMSGITWRPERAVSGYLSRAVASGGPCVLYARPYGRVAVNRGGILERFARRRFDAAQVLAVDDNETLPDLLAEGKAGAVVTDSFELSHFYRPGWRAACEPARDRKVYWIGPSRAATLGPRVDRWIEDNESLLRQLRRRWLGSESGRDAKAHIIDLLARRLAMMPAVARFKRAHDLPIEDAGREARVLHAAERRARQRGLDSAHARQFFQWQIELAKRVQRRASRDAPSLDLTTELRPTLLTLGRRIVDGLVECRGMPRATGQDLDLLVPFLAPDERLRLGDSLDSICVAR